MTIKTHTSFPDRPEVVVMVRVAPDHPKFNQALECSADYVKKGCSVYLFFHGPGVGSGLIDPPKALLALAENPHVRLVMCQAAWRRLGESGPAPWPEGSLIEFWSQMEQAQAVSVFGQGQWPSPPKWPSIPSFNLTQAQGFGMMVAHRPTVEDRQSLVECVLAAATLEVDLTLAFAGQGLSDWLATEDNPWLQLTDHDLVPVITAADEDGQFSQRLWWVA